MTDRPGDERERAPRRSEAEPKTDVGPASGGVGQAPRGPRDAWDGDDGGSVSDAIHARMLHALPERHDHPDLDAFYGLLRAYPVRRGKLLRGRLLVLAADAFDAPRAQAIELAAALELFQNWVLIHDDVEDDSDERRGEPALHRTVGVPRAINAGDALHVYMWDLLHRIDLPTDAAREVRGEFLHTIHRTAEGQHLDLAWVADGRLDVTEDDYLRMVALKTAWYTVIAPLRLGALAAGLEPPEALASAGADLGTAFQIRDDVLNLTPGSEGYGKEFAGDLYEGKRTLVLAHLFARASAEERRVLADGLAKPRGRRTEQDVDAILALVHRHGSLTYAQAKAEAHARSGLEALRRGLEAAPNPAAAGRVVDLMRTLTERTA